MPNTPMSEVPCQWFAACTNQTSRVGKVPFPPYPIPCCDRCAEVVGGMETFEAEFYPVEEA